MNNKRRQNNMNGGNGGGQQNRHNNNRPRRFGSNPNRGGADDPANIARTRRNATQSREKYQNMARDAISMGDRVLAENYLQHADHYYRVLMALPPEEIRQPYNQRGNQYQGGNNDPSFAGDGRDGMVAENNGVQAHDVTAEALPAFITHPSAQETHSQDNQ